MTFDELKDVVRKASKYEIRYGNNALLDCSPEDLRSAVAYITSSEDGAPVLRQVIEDLDMEHVSRLIAGDEAACRLATMEHIARHAAAELCVNGKYDVDTFIKMLSLPVNDFKLVTKRVVELQSMAHDVSNQSMNIGIAGT